MHTNRHPPTIALVARHGFATRYLLRTEICSELRRLGSRLIIFTPTSKSCVSEYEANSEHILSVPLRVDECLQLYRSRCLGTFLSQVRRYGSPVHNQWVVNRFEKLLDDSNAGGRNRLLAQLTKLAVYLARKSYTTRRTLRAIERLSLLRPLIHDDLFRQFRPDVLVTCSPGYDTLAVDVILLREAQRHGVKTIASVYAWDNAGTKGLPAFSPDYVLVWSEEMRKEIMQLLDIGIERTFTTGPAIFDVYKSGRDITREEFCKQYQLEPERPIIFFATMSPHAFPHNPDYLRLLADSVQTGEIPSSTQLLVRLHPIYQRSDCEEQLRKELQIYESLANQYPFIRYSIPQVQSRLLEMDMPASEMQNVAWMVKHTNVVANFFSTLQLEAAICDTPFINMGFDLPNHDLAADRPSEFALHRHNARSVASLAGRVAQSPGDLIQYMNEYLADPQLHRLERARFAEQECGPIDGKASERVANTIYKIAVGAQA